jgi:alpha-mannosidase
LPELLADRLIARFMIDIAHLNPISQPILEQLWGLSQQPTIAGWRYWAADLHVPTALSADLDTWTAGAVNEKQYLTWPAGQVQWLGQVITVPAELCNYPTQFQSLRLSLIWWSIDVQIYVNGQLVQAGDLFDARVRVLLSNSVQPGDAWDVRLRLVSPGHDAGALMQSIAIYESNNPQQPEPGFFATELAVLSAYLPNHPEIAQSLQAIDWRLLTTSVPAFQEQLQDLRQQLIATMQLPTTAQISLLSHAHLDMAWLWEVAETWEVADRTFQSVLALQADDPQLTFCHTSPALYAWLEEHRPQLFAQIQAQVKTGRWEVVGGMWIEPDLNLISGESIARQIIYGQRYVQAKFGAVSRVAWLPDTFGFCQQLPQLLQLGQIDYFVTQKFLWNDTNQFPHQLFWWQSPEGSQVLSYMSSPIGEGIEPVKMAKYAAQWTASTGEPDALWLLGVGDHGGGPSRDMLAIQKRWQQSPFCPPLKFTTAEQYLASKVSDQLPVWTDELYLEFHRGCYTTHADQKRANRQAEDLLYQAELWSTIANLLQGSCQPLPEIEQAWKLTLFNQFHDILPGSAIQPVYVTANEEWLLGQELTTQLINRSLTTLCQQLNLVPPLPPEAVPLVIFNSLNWSRTAVIHWPIAESMAGGQVYDDRGQLLPSEQSQGELIFVATGLPSVGYQTVWLVPTTSSTSVIAPTHWCLENQYVRVAIDPLTGDIASIFDKIQQCSVLAAPGNQLQSFTDAGQYWDAWNIDPHYAEHPLPPPLLKSITWMHNGEIEQRLQVVRSIGKSTFTQDYVLAAHTPELVIETTVDWQEEHVLVKATFPLSFSAATVTCEVPCGVMVRPTRLEQPLDRAKWEIPAYRWVDLTNPELNYGVSLFNDCKYGYSYQPDCLSLTLLRSSTWPDPQADIGQHQFTYSIYPHMGSWSTAAVVQRGVELNSPLQIVLATPQSGAAPSTHSFLDLGAAGDHLVLMAFSPAHRQADRVVLRCYESAGQSGVCDLHNSVGLEMGEAIDLLETPLPGVANHQLVQPWQIKSWLLHPNWPTGQTPSPPGQL